jgi:UDP-2-acetamido-3-amino-2,3-dideoxy-glucuronate N-acetyltransferase
MSTIDPSARIHPTADLEPDVRIGARTAVWHRAQIRSGASVGADSIVGRDAYVDAAVVVGDRVKIQNGALLYHGVTVEDGVFIGPGAIITNDRFPRAITPGGDLAQADDWTVTPTVLATGCSIGAGAVVVAGCDVGSYATVGAGAVVARKVPGHALVAGNPARIIGWVCICGDRLSTPDGGPAPADPGEDALTCRRCARRYTADGDSLRAAG